MKCRDLFMAVWISDLFMERVKEPNGKWSLFCPYECPGLSDVYGKEFVTLYTKYEAEGTGGIINIILNSIFRVLNPILDQSYQN